MSNTSELTTMNDKRNIVKLSELIKNNNENGFKELFNTLPNLDVNDVPEQLTGTLLQLACKNNLKNVVNDLLEKKANVNKTTKHQKDKPLEIAAIHGYWKIFDMLLKHYQDIPNVVPTLVQNFIYKRNAESDHKKCLELLVKNRNANSPVNDESNGNTPLHYAVKYLDCETIIDLLKNKASLGIKNADGVLPIDDIDPDVLERHLNNCIKIKEEKNCAAVVFEYDTLLPTDSTPRNKSGNDVIAVNVEEKEEEEEEEGDDTAVGETSPFLHTTRNKSTDDTNQRIKPCGKNKKLILEIDAILAMSKHDNLKHLLKHPVISTFVFVKWKKMRLLLNMNFTFYLLFVIFLYLRIFFENSLVIWYFLLVTYIIFIAREFVAFLVDIKAYWTDAENYLELFLILATGFVIFKEDKEDLLYKHIYATAIILSGVEMMLLVGQYDLFSTYITVFTTVLKNFIKFMSWSAALIIAVTLSFYKIYSKPQNATTTNQTNDFKDNNCNNTETHNNTQSDNTAKISFFEATINVFKELTLNFIKVIAMLTGELEASSLHLDQIAIFLACVFLMTFTLFNILNGFAVGDIQTIRNDAEFIILKEKMRRIAYIEKWLSVFQKYVKVVNANRLEKRFLLFSNNSETKEIEMSLYNGTININRTQDHTQKDTEKDIQKDISIDPEIVKSTKLIIHKQNVEEGKTNYITLRLPKNWLIKERVPKYLLKEYATI